jgi:hypothetical protein
MRLKIIWLLCAGLAGLPAAAAPEGDAWSGRYRLTWVQGPAADDKTPDMVFSIIRAPDADPTKPNKFDGRIPIPMEHASDADPAKLAEKLHIDLARWTLSSGEKIDPQDVGQLRRLPPENYKGLFGWDSMYAKGAIACLDGGYTFFICRVKPGTTVFFGREGPNQAKLLARTGLFGARLHVGAFELTKLDSRR